MSLKTTSLILWFYLIPFNSCNEENTSIIEGNWEDISTKTLLGGERYNFRFKGESFEIKKFMYSDVPVSQCTPTFSKYNYYSGHFNLEGDSMHFTGKLFKSTYLDSTGIEKIIPDCMDIYNKEYKYAYKYSLSGDTLILRPREEYSYGSFDENDSIGKMIQKKLTIYLKKSE